MASSGSCSFISPPVPHRNQLWPCGRSLAAAPAQVSLFFCCFYVSPCENTTRTSIMCLCVGSPDFTNSILQQHLHHLWLYAARSQRPLFHGQRDHSGAAPGALSPAVTFLTAALQPHCGPQRKAQPKKSMKPSSCSGGSPSSLEDESASP